MLTACAEHLFRAGRQGRRHGGQAERRAARRAGRCQGRHQRRVRANVDDYHKLKCLSIGRSAEHSSQRTCSATCWAPPRTPPATREQNSYSYSVPPWHRAFPLRRNVRSEPERQRRCKPERVILNTSSRPYIQYVTYAESQASLWVLSLCYRGGIALLGLAGSATRRRRQEALRTRPKTVGYDECTVHATSAHLQSFKQADKLCRASVIAG